ncbi:hypothetical protein HYV80_02965 [Candidatus Woesearchaeota archaeon]|nr:hypothetical protein [Candidatus Woesearchaeota archaeon]
MDPKEDEDISIDFSKIKNFFKSEKKEGEQTEENRESSSAEKKDDEEINIDFGKIKKWFKSDADGLEHSHASKPDDELPIDWSKIIGFFKKYGVIFIALIPIILSIYIRAQAGSLQFTDSWASSTVINNIKSQIKSSIDQQYPNLPDANKNALAEAELQKVISQNKAQIDQQIQGTSAYFKSFFQDENGKNYMPDIDPYYWYRYAKNIVDHGHPGDVLKDGKPFDNHQLAPLGRFVFTDILHSYLWAYFYKFLHFFIPGMTLMRSGFHLVIFFSALCVLLIFLIARKIAGNIGGFFAGLMMAVNGAFLSRSLHPDNDVSVVLFPLIVTWLFVTMIDMKSGFKIAVISVAAGFFTGLFTLAWSGWWYIFDFLLATIAITFLYLVLINFKEIKSNMGAFISNAAIRNIAIVGLLYFLSTLIFVVLFSGWLIFRNSFLGPLSFPSIKAPVSADLWPNVFTTVAELNEGSISGIINSIGGPFLFFISLLGLILAIYRSEGMKKFDYFYVIGTTIFYGAYFLLVRIGLDVSVFGLLAWIMLPIFARIGISVYKKDESYDFKLSILLSLWVASTIFASIKGIRFTVLLAPAFSVAFGVAIGKIYIYASKWLVKEFKVHRLVAASVLIVLFIGIVYASPTKAAINAARFDIPIVNDAWYNALIAINQNSSENAIITSWWDFGHHFKVLADRPVTFDGTTQTYPAAHWVGKLLMTDNEEQAAGILRMLDCGSNNAFNTLYKTNNNTQLSLKILNEIILLDKKEAEKRLKSFRFNEMQIEKILSFTHCQPPEAYFIASEDMIGKSGVWSHFGSWNFERAEIWQNRGLPQEQAVEKMMTKFNYTRERAENIYFEMQSIASDSEANAWVAPWPGYGGTISCGKNNGGVYACSNGFFINMSNHDVYAFGQQGIVRPGLAAFSTEDGLLKKSFNGTTVELGITIIPKNENEFEAVMSSKELTGSMFTRMFYMQGHGLKYFKLFNHQRGLTGTDIYTYKIDWEGKNKAIVGDYVKLLKTPVKLETEDLNLAQINEDSS